MNRRCGARRCAGQVPGCRTLGRGPEVAGRCWSARSGSSHAWRGRDRKDAAWSRRDPSDQAAPRILPGAGACRSHGGLDVASWGPHAAPARELLPISGRWNDLEDVGRRCVSATHRCRARGCPSRLGHRRTRARNGEDLRTSRPTTARFPLRRTPSVGCSKGCSPSERHAPAWSRHSTVVTSRVVTRRCHLSCLRRHVGRSARTARERRVPPSSGRCCGAPSCRSRARRSARNDVPSWRSRFVSSRWVRLDASTADEDLPLKCPYLRARVPPRTVRPVAVGLPDKHRRAASHDSRGQASIRSRSSA